MKGLDKISEHFRAYEFVRSQTASRCGIDNEPTEDAWVEIGALCRSLLEPARDLVGRPFTVTSGYRSKALNRRIRGSNTSAHCFGCAADIEAHDTSPRDLAKAFIDLDLPFDQIILEYPPNGWVHVGKAKPRTQPRKQILTARRKRNWYGRWVTYYVQGLE